MSRAFLFGKRVCLPRRTTSQKLARSLLCMCYLILKQLVLMCKLLYFPKSAFLSNKYNMSYPRGNFATTRLECKLNTCNNLASHQGLTSQNSLFSHLTITPIRKKNRQQKYLTNLIFPGIQNLLVSMRGNSLWKWLSRAI